MLAAWTEVAMRRCWLMGAICVALLGGVVRMDTATAGNLYARRYGLYQYDRPWYTLPPGYFLNPYRPWFTLPYRYLYQSFGYNLPDPYVGTCPPLFVPADELIGYPFLRYGAAPLANEVDVPFFDEEAPGPPGNEWPPLEAGPGLLSEELLEGCYYW
jgi:hypothetical protein